MNVRAITKYEKANNVNFNSPGKCSIGLINGIKNIAMNVLIIPYNPRNAFILP
jgi:hypothetical protein